MEQRIDSEATQAEAAELWFAAFLLMGLIYPQNFTKPLFQGVRAMKESSSYQAILDEGRAEGEMRGEIRGEMREATKLLKKLGTRQFGAPDHSVLMAIEAITDLDRIELLLERLLEVSSWEELLAPE
jgi:predicted transposase YdaD